MNREDLETWLLEHPALLIYAVALLAGSLISFVVLARRLTQARRIGTHPIPHWPLSGLDFSLFLAALVLWFILSGALLLHLHRWIAGDTERAGSGMMVLGGLLLQAGMLYLFLRFRFHYRNPNEGPLNPRIMSNGQGLILGLFYFLASLPVIYGVGVLWNGILELLRQQGFDIDLPMQDAVLLFQQADSPLVIAGLVLLAVVVAPVVEETVFRAGVFRFLKGKTSLSLSLVVSGLLFGMVHGNLQSLPGLVTVGICLGLAYELSGNLRVPIFFHAFFNLNSLIWILLLPEAANG